MSVVGLVELPREEVAIGQLTADDLGQMVQVEGEVAGVVPFSRGMKYTLDDGTGTITLLLWQEIHEAVEDPAALTTTARLAVHGEVAEYQGNLELVPQFPSDIKVLTAAKPATVTATLASQPTSQPIAEPTSRPTAKPTSQPTTQPPATATVQPTSLPATRPIANITVEDVGHGVLVEGRIAGVDYFSAGVKYSLEDGTGRIILLVWQNVLEEIAGRYDLFPAARCG